MEIHSQTVEASVDLGDREELKGRERLGRRGMRVERGRAKRCTWS